MISPSNITFPNKN